MIRISTFALASFTCLAGLFAQTSDIVVFSDAGEKFTLVIDGDVKNDVPATRVVATGIRNETPMLAVNFEDKAIPALKQNGWMEPGTEYTLRITTNKKGQRVLRMQGQAPLGSAASNSAGKPVPTEFVEDVEAPVRTTQTIVADAPVGTQTTTTVTEGGTGERVNMNVGVNGIGMNVGVNVTDGTGGTMTTTTTTTTTYSQSGTLINEDPTLPIEEEPITTTGCMRAMSPADFQDAKTSIASKGFEETKLTLAKQIGGSNCFTSAQVKDIMELFGFEDSKLDFAKFAYDHVIDVNNYYKVNDAFGFSSSVDELDKYIQGR